MIYTRTINNIVKWTAYILLCIGAVLLVCVFIFFAYRGVHLSGNDETIDFQNTTGPIGDFIGGVIGTVFSLASALLVVVTLSEQNRNNRRDHFVQDFFEMLKIHSENVQNMVIHNHKSGDVRGREVFSVLVKIYNQIYDIIHSYMLNILNGGCYDNHDNNQMIEYLKENSNLLSMEMRLAYGYFFFGSTSYRLLNPLNTIERQIETEVLRLLNYNQIYIDGYHVMLGHYYRHMYQMVMLIIHQQDLIEEEKYMYAKQLRAQLNDDEQLLLYYNVMAEVGSEWLATYNKIEKIEDMCLLARFRMIKNIPSVKAMKGITPYEKFTSEISIYKKLGVEFFEQSEMA